MAMIQCPTCGNMEDVQAAVCSECGAPIAASKKCEECGCPLDSDSTFCPECGNPVENASNAVVFPAANHTSGESSPIQQNIYSPPPAALRSANPPAAGKKTLMVFNIIGLLLMILPTILFMGKILEFNVNEKVVESYSFPEFTKITDKVKGLVGAGNLVLEFLNSSSARMDSLYDYLDMLSSLRYVYYAVFLFSVYKFISGWFKVNKGKLLAYCFNVSWIYLLLGGFLHVAFAAPVNDLDTPFTFSLSFNIHFLLGFALFHFLFYAILVFALRDDIRRNKETKGKLKGGLL